jgi:hypothetical protein
MSSSTKDSGAIDDSAEAMLKGIRNLLEEQVAYINRVDTSEDPEELLWIESLFPATLALASFGGSITFSVIPSQLEPSHNSRIGEQKVRNFLALAWLFFALALATASAGQLVLSFHRDVVKDSFDKKSTGTLKRMQKLAVWFLCWFPVSLLLQVLILLAFLFLSLVIAAYAPAVGWVAVGFTSFAVPVAVFLWCLQNCSKTRTE